MTLTATPGAGSPNGSTGSWTPSPEELAAYRRSLAPRFANDQQAAFFWSEAPELLYSGAFGAGKSRILCEKAHALGLEYAGAPIAIVRKVSASLAATTRLTYLHDVLVPSGVPFRQHKTEGWVEYPNGSRVWFFGLDADPTTGVPSKIGSFDAAFIFVDEAVELDEGDWVMLQGRLRSTTTPFRQLAAATNPADPKHWLKARFTPPSDKRVYLHAPTFANRFLPADYLERMGGLTGLYRSRYAEGQWVAVAGALWAPDDFVRYSEAPMRVTNGELKPEYRRIVIGVDPAVTANPRSDETGIVVVGLGVDGRAYVLDDLSGRFPPEVWGHRVARAFDEHKADAVVVETNNGGDLVKLNLQAADRNLPIIGVVASRGKIVRAEPIARLYKDGRVSHARRLAELEQQMCAYDPTDRHAKSPDRLDALVWALTELMLGRTYSGPADDFSTVA